MIMKQDIPNSTHEALHEQHWRKAMEVELVSLPEGRKAIGSHWHFTVKYGPDGELKRYKARFVAKGFSQREGLD